MKEVENDKIDKNKELYEKDKFAEDIARNHGKSQLHNQRESMKDVIKNSGQYKDINGEKKNYEDGKMYHGGQQSHQSGTLYSVKTFL